LIHGFNKIYLNGEKSNNMIEGFDITRLKSLKSEFGSLPLTKNDFNKAIKKFNAVKSFDERLDLWLNEFEEYWADFKEVQYPPMIITEGVVDPSEWNADNCFSILFLIDSEEKAIFLYNKLCEKYKYYQIHFMHRSPKYLSKYIWGKIKECIKREEKKIVGEFVASNHFGISCIEEQLNDLNDFKLKYEAFPQTFRTEIFTIKIVVDELTKVIVEAKEETAKGNLYSFFKTNFIPSSQALNQEIEKINKLENKFFKGMPMKTPIEHFKKLTEEKSKNGKPFLTEVQLISFLNRVFLHDQSEKMQKINYEYGEKGIIIKLFYEFYDIAMKDYSGYRKKERYIKLLSDNFFDMEYDTIKYSFRSDITRKEW
jgi:hypothetical protein